MMTKGQPNYLEEVRRLQRQPNSSYFDMNLTISGAKASREFATSKMKIEDFDGKLRVGKGIVIGVLIASGGLGLMVVDKLKEFIGLIK